MFRHVVLFKFKDTVAEADVAAVQEAFSALPGKIDRIQAFEWGLIDSIEGLDQGFTHCFFVTFATRADCQAYIDHPDHRAFVEVLKPHLETALVVDYVPGT